MEDWCDWCEAETPCLCDDLEPSCDCDDDYGPELWMQRQDEWWAWGN